MARIRSIKPGFFASEDVSALPLRARLTWIGLWTHCDDQGRAKDNVKLIKAAVWPLDEVSLREVEEDLVVLAARGRIVRYEVGGIRYLAVANWLDHQKINKPTESRLPAPPVTKGDGPRPAPPERPVDNAVDNREPEPDTTEQTTPLNPSEPLPESSGRAPLGKGREGKGKERISPRARERQATRLLQDRYRLTDHEASQVLEAVKARAREPITNLPAYLDGMTEGDLADLAAAAMDTTAAPEAPTQHEPAPEPAPGWGRAVLAAVPDPEPWQPADPPTDLLDELRRSKGWRRAQ